MRHDHELLHAYLGDEMFYEMGHAYVKGAPSEHPNLRWFFATLPEFLKSTRPTAITPCCPICRRWKKALNRRLDGKDARC